MRSIILVFIGVLEGGWRVLVERRQVHIWKENPGGLSSWT